ncbi:hypothetical protein [Streptomyces sp. NBC_01235]|nr:hypothetical protein OG289_46580 [Streptomyces sp. NBC_01235]
MTHAVIADGPVGGRGGPPRESSHPAKSSRPAATRAALALAAWRLLDD